MEELKNEDLKKYNNYLTVGKLKEILNNNKDIIEDVYFEKHGWKVYLVDNQISCSAKEHNKKIKNGEYLNKEEYPLIDKDLKPFTEDNIKSLMSQYHPAWYCFEKDNKIFINLHY